MMVLPICAMHELYYKPYFLEIDRMHIIYTILPTKFYFFSPGQNQVLIPPLVRGQAKSHHPDGKGFMDSKKFSSCIKNIFDVIF